MKAIISQKTWVTKTIEVPKEWEFYFTKDECEWTNKEWDLFESNEFLGLKCDNFSDDILIEEIEW